MGIDIPVSADAPNILDLFRLQPGVIVYDDPVNQLPLPGVDINRLWSLQPGVVSGKTPAATGCPWYSDLKSGVCVTPSTTLLIGAAVSALVMVFAMRN